MSKAEDFIKKHGLDYRNIVLEDLMGEYLEEMQRGLDGEPSSLLMLPSYINMSGTPRRNEPVVCIDAGGTNLRIAVARFDDSGAFTMSEITRDTMPGARRELSAQEFFDVMAQIIAPFCKYSQNFALSFAYQIRITEEIDAEIIHITKEVKVRGSEGKFLAKEIKASLSALGLPGINIIVLNDTVASALSGKAEHSGYGAYTGTVLGTGSNSCYIEEISKIGKLKGMPDGLTAINTEAGSYNKLPRTDLDIAFAAETDYPESGIAEKMTSGAYIGALCGYALSAAAEEGVFETKAIELAEDLKPEDVAEFLSDGSGIVAEYMINEEDEENARAILKNLVLRAGRFAALQMAAMIEKSYKSNNRICMSIEGSVYQKMPFLKEELTSCLKAYAGAHGYEADLVTVEHAILKGCTIAGLST